MTLGSDYQSALGGQRSEWSGPWILFGLYGFLCHGALARPSWPCFLAGWKLVPQNFLQSLFFRQGLLGCAGGKDHLFAVARPRHTANLYGLGDAGKHLGRSIGVERTVPGTTGRDAAADTVRQILENGLVKLVASFQQYAEAVFLSRPNASSFPIRKNLFQNLGESSDRWRDATGNGIEGDGRRGKTKGLAGCRRAPVESDPLREGNHENGAVRWDTHIRFYTTDCVKAGFLVKGDGRPPN
jgi:hypothetical protein